MKYKKYGETYYARFDRGEEIIQGIIGILKQEGIGSCTFTAIGGCDEAELQTFIPETGTFETEKICGMLELLSLNGNVTTAEDGNLQFHAHAMISYKKDGVNVVAGGHTKSVRVRYTGEVEIRPVIGGTIRRIYNPETGTGFWGLE